MPWMVIVPAFLLAIVWAVMFVRQLKGGLARTAMDDKFAWGLYVQGFFYFSSLAGGILIFIGVITLLDVKPLGPLAEIGASVSLSLLAAAGLLLASDLGKPFRSLMILTGGNFTSPLTWDFYMICLCGLVNLLFIAGLVPMGGALAAIWAVSCIAAALGFVMIHTLFFLSRVGPGFRSQPFLGLDSLAQSLWGGTALLTLLASGSGMYPPNMGRLLLVLTVFTLISLAGGVICNFSTKQKEIPQKRVLFLDLLILLSLLSNELFRLSVCLPAAVSVLILLSVYLEKSHLIRVYQIRPSLPLPYSRYDEVPEYSPTAGEWLLTAGSLGVCILLGVVIHYWRSAMAWG